MAGDPTFGDLYKNKAILEADLEGAVDAVMADPTTFQLVIGKEHTADLAVAVAASSVARSMLDNPKVQLQSKRSAVRTAILLSRPVKG